MSECEMDAKIKNVIFDFGGVIINLARNRCIDAFERLGIANLREQVVGSCQRWDLFMQLELGNISPVEFRNRIRHLSQQVLTDEAIDAAWNAMLGDIPSEKLELLLELRQRYNIYLLSNTNVIHWEWAEKNPLSYNSYHASDFFDRIYLSYQLHLLKPDPSIFEYVLQDAGIRPEETFFMDDSLQNCRSAASLGIQTYTPQPREDWSYLFK